VLCTCVAYASRGNKNANHDDSDVPDNIITTYMLDGSNHFLAGYLHHGFYVRPTTYRLFHGQLVKSAAIIPPKWLRPRNVQRHGNNRLIFISSALKSRGIFGLTESGDARIIINDGRHRSKIRIRVIGGVRELLANSVICITINAIGLALSKNRNWSLDGLQRKIQLLIQVSKSSEFHSTHNRSFRRRSTSKNGNN